jgi:hypothetical protein
MLPAWATALITALVAAVVYVRTACRTVFVGDSGELAAAVHTLGVAHPPGYPLYVLTGKLFSLALPVGRPVWRLNLYSAAMAAASVGFLQATLAALGLPWFISTAAALAWAFSASLWSQSGIARVYALGAALSSAATWLAVVWYVSPDPGYEPVWAAFLIVGLGIANHPIAAAHVPAIAALVLTTDRATLAQPTLWAGCAVCLLPGIALYAWVPWRARRGAVVNWGNVRTSREVWDFLRRKQYWQHRYVERAGDGWQVIAFYLRRIVDEFGFLGAASLAVGLFPIAREHAPVLIMALVLVLLNVVAMIAHARREDIFHWTRYMLTAWYAMALVLPFGWWWMIQALPEGWQPWAAFALPAGLLVTRFRRHDLSRHAYADAYNRRILECLPENATLIAQDDNVVFPLMYLKYVEGVRPDVKLLEQGVHQLEPLRFNPRRDAVYCTHWNAAFNQSVAPGQVGLRLIPEGVIYRVISTDMIYRPRDLWNVFLLPDMEDRRIPRNYLTRCLLGHIYFMRAEWAAMHQDMDALAWYERAARMGYDDGTLHYNIALAYRRSGWRLASEEMFARAAALDRKFASPPAGHAAAVEHSEPAARAPD